MKIMVSAYLDNNIGDDLMIKLLADYFNQHEYYLYTNKSTVVNTFKDYNNIIFSRPEQRKKDLSKMDLFLSIGGSIFNDLNTIKGQVARLRKLSLLKKAKKNKVKIATIGCNLGPYNNKWGVLLTKLELKKNDLVTTRDRNSFDMIKEFKEVKNYHLFEDVVYNYNFTNEREKNTGLGISVYRSLRKNENNYDNYKGLAKIADEYIEKTNKKVRLFPFDSENENDLSAAHHVQEMSKYKDKIEIIPYLGNQEEFINRMAECEKIIAIRFHSAILADILRIPFLPIIYSNKMSSLLEDRNYEGKCYDISDLNVGNAHEIVNDLLDDKQLYNQFNNFENNSINHFIEFGKLLK